ncbi:hypothetical protein BC936DRAFT_136585 [Jimgerdemannia flammicorona]|uniref:Uncharacterized protein n=2 Tax=Jimgerdemannia flammicorona TaxID=994334 RepID=A0A433CZ62_9FUNG|nr:hypothetical protein BC936DRAFT_136585 [Jimgerdemannia flammicorona]
MGIISSKRLLKEEKTQSKTLSDCTQQQDTNSSQWFNNREFKAIENPNYMLPGDGQEVDRLHIQHVCVR